MKNKITLLITFFTISINAQLTDANFQQAIDDCLATNPVDGLCTNSPYGIMPDWDVSQVTDMSDAFRNREDFNADIGNWDVSNVISMRYIFNNAYSFNQPIGGWNVSSVTDMQGVFAAAYDFNGDISSWDVSSVTSMYLMFSGATSFNQPIGDWNVSNLTNVLSMFSGATSFNQDLNNWDVSNLTDMSYMFYEATSFNGDISNWDVSNVTTMTDMFRGCNSFSGNLASWNLTNLTNMNFMFAEIDNFNINLWNFDTSNVTTMRFTFYDSQFDQDISSWDVSNVSDMNGIFTFSGLSTNNYDLILNGWSQQNLQSAVTLQADGVYYCNGEDARQSIIDNYGWVIVDAGLDCSTAGIDDQNQLDISIYPNPTSDIVYIEGNYSQLKVVVYDILGKQVMKESITNSFDISDLENGIYLLQFTDGVKISSQKIIKN